MRRVFSRSRRAAAAWLLIVVLLAPSALACDTTENVSLWAEFVAWLAGITAPDDDGFSVWLMGRIGVPGG